MKNFRKVLALVLAVALFAGIATMTSAAFTDAESIDKTEAVEVMSALGIINGYKAADGTYSFNPEGTVTRAEMAKMIATILNGGEDVGELYKGACTFEDAKNHWAAGYIAYCNAEGIISGRNETTFDPNGKVTGLEAAKMALGALGYEDVATGMAQNANWASNVTTYARTHKLFANVDGLTSQPITRENAAQLLFNALNANTVTVDGGSNVTVNGVTIVTGATVKVTETILAKASFDNLVVTENVNDAYGRPGTEWKLNGKVLLVAAYEPTGVYTDATKTHQIYTDIGVDGLKGATVVANGVIDIWCDGENVVDGDEIRAAYEEAVAAYDPDEPGAVEPDYNTMVVASGNGGWNKYWRQLWVYKGVSNTQTSGALGQITEVYFENDRLTLVHINTYVGKVTDIDSDGKATVTNMVTDVVETNAKKLSGVKEGDVIFYTVDGLTDTKYDIATFEAATPVTATLETYKGSATVTEAKLSGTTYKAAANGKALSTSMVPGEDYVLYLDAQGNVLYWEGVEEAKTYPVAYVLNAANQGGDWAVDADATYLAKLLLQTGEVVTVETADYYDEYIGSAVRYSVKKDVYTLTTDNVADTLKIYNAEGVDGEGTVNNSKVAVTAGGAEVTANLSTIFVVETIKSGVSTYTAYTGVANVPTLTSADSAVVCADTATDKKADVVFLMDAELVDAPNLEDVGISVVYFANNGNTTTIVTEDGSYVARGAIVDGDVVSLKIEKELYTTLFNANNGNVGSNKCYVLFDSYEVDENGFVVDMKLSSAAAALVETVAVTAKYNDGVMGLKIGSAPAAETYVDGNAPAYIYNANSDVKAMTATSAKNLTTSFKGVALMDGDQIVAFYGYDSLA